LGALASRVLGSGLGVTDSRPLGVIRALTPLADTPDAAGALRHRGPVGFGFRETSGGDVRPAEAPDSDADGLSGVLDQARDFARQLTAAGVATLDDAGAMHFVGDAGTAHAATRARATDAADGHDLSGTLLGGTGVDGSALGLSAGGAGRRRHPYLADGGATEMPWREADGGSADWQHPDRYDAVPEPTGTIGELLGGDGTGAPWGALAASGLAGIASSIGGAIPGVSDAMRMVGGAARMTGAAVTGASEATHHAADADLGGGVAAEDGATGLDATDLDELARRLYDRLRSRLRIELLVDRERAGLLVDHR
jgi:hypothetical protein